MAPVMTDAARCRCLAFRCSRLLTAMAGFVCCAGIVASPVADAQQPTFWDRTQRAMKQTTNFLTFRERLDEDHARDLYQQGDAVFRQAASARSAVARDAEDDPRRRAEFKSAAKLFQKAHEADPQSGLGQDALFMQAESLFFSDQLVDASDVYGKLQKDFPRSRHSDRVASRLFSITQYWIETEKAGNGNLLPINLFDDTRPTLDVDGHAVRVLDQIRYDDPTGRLADDATMAAAVEKMRQKDFEMADEFLTDLRETFPDSEHFFMAHFLGVRCKLERYAGPRYTNALLEDADELIRQTRQRFPTQLHDPDTSEKLAKASAVVAYYRAEHLHGRAEYREKRKEFRAAGLFYQQILDEFSDTPFADRAREGLQRCAGKPAKPVGRLSALKRLFPDQRRKTPLELNFESPTGESRATVLR